MIVSLMLIGAGSVEVSARPALPTTHSTSGNDLIVWSCSCMTRKASSRDRRIGDRHEHEIALVQLRHELGPMRMQELLRQ
jgi:hypothetical protein